MRNFKKLKIWEKGMTIVTETYALTKQLPADEKFGLTSQTRRAAVSIPSNIAEGSCKKSQKEYRYFIETATGSGFELETQLLICKQVGYLNGQNVETLLELIMEEQKMLTRFSDRL